MTNQEFINLAVKTVVDYFNKRVEETDRKTIDKDDVYIVWLCKTLQNHKALLSTNISDGMYYELTYNGNKNELYLDAYKKWENKCFKLDNLDIAFTKESNINNNLIIKKSADISREEINSLFEDMAKKGYQLYGENLLEEDWEVEFHFKKV